MDIKKCKDPVFGEMTYKYKWQREQEETIFGKQYKLKVTADAFSAKPINNKQRAAYQQFKDNKNDLYKKAEEKLINYINVNVEELTENWLAARRITNSRDLTSVVIPTKLLFKQDGTLLLLLECVWDEDAGVAVKLLPDEDVTVGRQDMFL